MHKTRLTPNMSISTHIRFRLFENHPSILCLPTPFVARFYKHNLAINPKISVNTSHTNLARFFFIYYIQHPYLRRLIHITPFPSSECSYTSSDPITFVFTICWSYIWPEQMNDPIFTNHHTGIPEALLNSISDSRKYVNYHSYRFQTVSSKYWYLSHAVHRAFLHAFRYTRLYMLDILYHNSMPCAIQLSCQVAYIYMSAKGRHEWEPSELPPVWII